MHTGRLCTLSELSHFGSPAPADLAAVCASIYHPIQNITLSITLKLTLTQNSTLNFSYLTNKHRHAQRDVSARIFLALSDLFRTGCAFDERCR